jgi:hypothetical protein
MAVKKIPDSALREAIKANPNGTYTAIAKAVGLATGGYTYRRIDKIRAELNGAKSTEPTLSFSDIRENDRLMRAGKRLVVVTTEPSYIRVRRMDGTTETISRKDFSEHAAEYTRVSAGDPQGGPVTTYYIEPGTEVGKGGPGPSQIPQPGSGGRGYWIAESEADYKRFRAEYVSRASNILKTVVAMDNAEVEKLAKEDKQ